MHAVTPPPRATHRHSCRTYGNKMIQKVALKSRQRHTLPEMWSHKQARWHVSPSWTNGLDSVFTHAEQKPLHPLLSIIAVTVSVIYLKVLASSVCRQHANCPGMHSLAHTDDSQPWGAISLYANACRWWWMRFSLFCVKLNLTKKGKKNYFPCAGMYFSLVNSSCHIFH